MAHICVYVYADKYILYVYIYIYNVGTRILYERTEKIRPLSGGSARHRSPGQSLLRGGSPLTSGADGVWLQTATSTVGSLSI